MRNLKSFNHHHHPSPPTPPPPLPQSPPPRQYHVRRFESKCTVLEVTCYLGLETVLFAAVCMCATVNFSALKMLQAGVVKELSTGQHMKDNVLSGDTSA